MNVRLRREATRVVVTGIGLRTALGTDAESSWSGLRSGRSGASSLDVEGDDRLGNWYGYPILGMDRSRSEPGLDEARAALADAGLIEHGVATFERDRVATVIGLSKGNLARLARTRSRFEAGWPATAAERVEDWTEGWPDASARSASARLDLRGPSLAPIAACATGVVAVLRAAALIREGACDVALAGSSDSSCEPLVLGAFDRMRALARVAHDPRAAVRPWDCGRSGFLVGEGGAVLVLERAEHARARGCLAYAEIGGGALGSDASHETNLDPDPTRLAVLIGEALARADVGPSDVDYVNVHGTATRVNDPLECRALRRALGTHADAISCSANKAQIGHLLGGAGAAELAISCLALRDQFVPPTLNLDEPDPSCDLDGTPWVGRARPIRVALKLSLGFGGHLAVAVLRRPDGQRRPTIVHVDPNRVAIGHPNESS